MSFADTIFNWLPKWRRSDGALVEAACDADGALRVSVTASRAGSATWVEPEPGTPLTHRRVVTRTPGRILRRVYTVNTGTVGRTFMLFDLGAIPPAGTQPTFAWPVPAGEARSLDVVRAFASGITWAVSIAPGAYAEDTGAAFWVNFDIE